MKLLSQYTLLTLLCFLFAFSSVRAEEKGEKEDKPAVVLAIFGTTVPSALPGIMHIKERLQGKFPHTEIRIAFTSNMIRKIWHKRQNDKDFQRKNPSIPQDIYSVKGPLATLADLQDDGYMTIIVQPGHISLGEEYLDLLSYIDGLNSIHTIKSKNQPFRRLVVGRPALGAMGSKHPYTDDINEVAKALAGDVKKAQGENAALLYMGHGNEFFPSSGAYLELVNAMNTKYPETKTYIAMVEGFPSLDTVIEQMKKDDVKKVVLKPFMTVAGDHAHNDMAGDEEKSMKSILTKNGFEVTPVFEGLGEQDGFADVFASHLAETASDSGISLQ
jgi:sirohydrochlorin cobaltochelatase